MDYIRLDHAALHREWEQRLPYRLDGEHHGPNPFSQQEADDGLDTEDAWTAWFLAVDTIDPQKLKDKVAPGLHDLIDGAVPCPVCGATLGYRPHVNRWYLRETCPSCGYTCVVCDGEEARRSEQWTRWQREHHLPTSLSESWLARDLERRREQLNAGESKQLTAGETVAETAGTTGTSIILAEGIVADIRTGTVYPATMSLEEALALTA